MKNIKIIFSIISTIIVSLSFGQQTTKNVVLTKKAGLIVQINGIKDTTGTMYVRLYDSKENFNIKKTKWKRMIPVKKSQLLISFDNLPIGSYAIICFQDINDNKKLDFDSFMPTEPWGLSNNKTLMGPPTWNDAVFELKNDKVVKIQLF